MANIQRLVTVTRDGMHNAFTDLIYWQGMYVVSYRKGAPLTTAIGSRGGSCARGR